MLALSLFSSCGEMNWVTDVEVRSEAQNNQVIAGVTTYLDTDSLILPSIDVPVSDPKTGADLGHVSIQSVITGPANAALDIELNLSEIAKLPNLPSEHVLPNGKDLPVTGFNKDIMITLPIINDTSRLYIELNTAENRLLVGTAITIKEFDKIGSSIGSVNLFPGFVLDNGVTGVFGLFTGSDQWQSGFAVFVNASQALENKSLSTSLAQTSEATGLSKLQLAQKSRPSEPLEFQLQETSSRKERRIGSELRSLSRRRKVLSLQ